MAKLILDIDPQTIEHIKQIADQKHLSVSAIAEKLFNDAVVEELHVKIDEAQSENEVADEDPFLEKIKKLKVSDSVKALTGILKGKVPEDATVQDLKYEYLRERHGL